MRNSDKYPGRCPQRDHFDSFIDKSGDCWLWMGAREKGKWAYGSLALAGKRKIRTHVFAWKRAHGEIPAGLQVCHICDNPPCCNPKHLFLGTHKQNQLDKIAKKRQAKGEKSGAAKLTSEQVRQIRNARKYRGYLMDLAKEHGISPGYVTNLRGSYKKLWVHLK